jgi:hypothetical protein
MCKGKQAKVSGRTNICMFKKYIVNFAPQAGWYIFKARSKVKMLFFGLGNLRSCREGGGGGGEC